MIHAICSIIYRSFVGGETTRLYLKASIADHKVIVYVVCIRLVCSVADGSSRALYCNVSDFAVGEPR